MSAIKWRFNGEEIPINPDRFAPSRVKEVEYRRLIDDNQVRVIPPTHHHTASYEIGWSALPDAWRNKLYDWYLNDETVTIESHIVGNPRERWTVKFDSFTSELRHGKQVLWNVQITARSVVGVNDPILRKTYKDSPALFVIENSSNRAINDVSVYIQGLNGKVENPFITQTYLNLLQNPGFESLDGWVYAPSIWQEELIDVYEGDGRSVKTFTPHAPISQEVWCPPDEHLTAMLYAKGSREQRLKITLEYKAIDGTTIDTYEFEDAVSEEWAPIWFSTESPTPSGTARAVFRVEKISDDEKFLYLDRALLRLGAYEFLPAWTNHKHRTMKYNGTLASGDVLRINMLSRQADINGLEHVHDLIEGNEFTIPVGKSLVVIYDEGTYSSVLTMFGMAEIIETTEVSTVIRFNDSYV